MLSIRLQRLGRKGYPVYRVAVQEAQRHPSSGRVVAYVGSYNPHTKEVRFDKEKTELYLKNGAQPSPHVVKLMVQEKIALPAWVKVQGKKDKKLRNPDKLRRNRAPEPADEPVVAKDSELEAEPAIEKNEAKAGATDSSDSTVPANDISASEEVDVADKKA